VGRLNLILFEANETQAPLHLSDPRAQHLVEVLHASAGSRFDAGLIQGPRGKGTVVSISACDMTLTFAWDAAPVAPLESIYLIIGLPRPQTARDLLRELSSLGVAAIHFVATEKTEAGYATSKLWSTGEWRRHLVTGAAQAFTTLLPEVTWGRPLSDVIATVPAGSARVALDNYEAAGPLSAFPVLGTGRLTLALGPERGWSAADRTQLRAAGFTLAHLGARVLRVETAAIAAMSVALAGRKKM
jgi:16S rRNA (uracil1498-N3)-methyltransferase